MCGLECGGLLSAHHTMSGVCFSVVRVVLWNGGGGRCAWSRRLSSPSSPLASSSFVVGVRGSARAALRARTLSPNTIVSFLLLFLLFCSVLFCLPPFFVRRFSSVTGMAVCVVYHVSLCSVGMTAMGSLSLSSSFFW